jgi:CheY-like chemotaxis protein
LLDLARLANGMLMLAPACVRISELMGAALDAVQVCADEKRIELRLELGHALGYAQFDPARLRQVLLNLLMNAIKFTPAGGRVTLRAHRCEGFLEIEVRDSGRGIEPALLPLVFAGGRAFRERHDAEGFGIGLALCRKLIELQGGSIEAQSPGVGAGSTFRVRLPCVEERASSVPEQSEDARPAPGSPLAPLTGLQLLIVEDDDSTREAMCWTLAQAGARVTEATSAESALELLQRDVWPDAIVSDLALPQMSGCELIERVIVAARRAGRAAPPACAVSAHARDSDRRRALDAGFDLYLAKPVTAAQLLEAAQDLRDIQGMYR